MTLEAAPIAGPTAMGQTMGQGPSVRPPASSATVPVAALPAGSAAAGSRSLAADAGYVALGLAFATGDAVNGLARRAARRVARSPLTAVATQALKRAEGLPLAPRVETFVADLDRRGRRELQERVAVAATALDSMADRVATSDSVVHIVNDVVARVLWPIVDEVLPAVIDRLAEDPEPIQALMVSQSAGIVDDVTASVRGRAHHADDRAASLVDRLLRRRARVDGSRQIAPVGVP